MKFAIVDHKKVEATKGAKGICPSCGSDVIARCGEIKVHHWAHKGIRNCDSWWENETEWHRSWKQYFPDEWQEVVHTAKDGEKHIADVKTGSGWVLEFQHSSLKPEERRSRDKFYPKLVWVVDGVRRKRDRKQFYSIIEHGRVIHNQPTILKIDWLEECKIITEWITSTNIVFFDFQESNLWFLLPIPSNLDAYLMTIHRKEFVDLQKNEGFENLFKKKIQPLIDQLKRLKSQKQRNKNLIVPRIGLSNRELRGRNRRF